MGYVFVSAAHKSSGKTTVSLGLCAAFHRRGLQVQPFKKGPDYIDPLWLGRAAGRPCYNLDPYLSTMASIRAEVEQRMQGADIGLIEGNKGLYDGLDLDGSNSNAAVAEALEAPVLLVLDARGMTRGIAPLILGYQAFGDRVDIRGVILNRLGGSRHEGKLRAVIEHYTDVEVLGAIHEQSSLAIDERHLGLIPSNESEQADHQVEVLGDAVAAEVDLDRIFALAGPPGFTARLAGVADFPEPRVTIGLPRDEAFGFYYPSDLEALRRAGARLVEFDSLKASHLPLVDGLFVGGGFPETCMDQLEANHSLRSDLADQIEAGLPVYAECGGLMYLCREIMWDGRRCSMVGAIPADVHMEVRPQGRGYVQIEETEKHPWPFPSGAGSSRLRGHEFHYSRLANYPADLEFAYRVYRGFGVDGVHDGIVHRNVLASYSHLRNVGDCDWAERFVAFVEANKTRKETSVDV